MLHAFLYQNMAFRFLHAGLAEAYEGLGFRGEWGCV